MFSLEFTADLANLRVHSGRVQTQRAEIRRLRTAMKPLQECAIQIDYADNYASYYATTDDTTTTDDTVIAYNI